METRLNLLSPEKKQIVKSVVVLASLQSLMVMVAIVAVLLSGILLAFRLTIGDMVSAITERATVQSDEYGDLLKQISSINDFTARVEKSSGKMVRWSKVLEEIAGITPDGVTLNTVDIRTDGTISLTGIAKSRNDMLEMERALKQNTDYANVTSPLSNILQKENLKFEFEMTYSPAAKN